MRKPFSFSDTMTHACAFALVMCSWAAAQQQQQQPITLPSDPVVQDEYEPGEPAVPAQAPGKKNAKGFPTGNQNVRGHLALIDPATGKLQPVDDVRLQILRQWRSGNSVMSTKDGSYGLGNVAPGVYSVIARGPNAFAAFSVNLHADSGVHDSTKSPIDLIIAAVPTSNMPQTKKLLEQTQPTGFETRKPVELAGVVNGRQDGDVRLLLSSYQTAELTDDSRLTGRIHRLDPVTGKDLPIINSTVYLLRNDHVVGREKLNRDGTFSMKFIRPAAYSLVASGEDGFLAISVDVVPHKNGARRKGAPTPVRFQEQVVQEGDVIDEFGVEAAFVPVELLQEEEVVQEEGVPVIITQGGAGFVGGAGGGSAGGGLASVLVGTGIGVLLATDDDDDRAQASPGSP